MGEGITESIEHVYLPDYTLACQLSRLCVLFTSILKINNFWIISRVPMMSKGPVPSVLCSISDLPSRSVGDKVRFLGWYAAPCQICSGALALMSDEPVASLRTSSQLQL